LSSGNACQWPLRMIGTNPYALGCAVGFKVLLDRAAAMLRRDFANPGVRIGLGRLFAWRLVST
jgi:hypothetical protein